MLSCDGGSQPSPTCRAGNIKQVGQPRKINARCALVIRVARADVRIPAKWRD